MTAIMERMRRRAAGQLEAPRVDLNQGFAEALRKDPPMRREPDEFAPTRVAKRDIEQIKEFGALPLQQIDEQLAELRAEMAGAEKLGQKIRDMIMEIRQDYMDKLERSRKVAKLTQASFAKLAEEFAAIDAPPPADTPADETAKEAITNEQLQPPQT